MHTASCSGLLPDGDGGLLTREALHDGHGVTCFMDSCQEPQGMVPIIGAHGWLRAVAKARGTTTDPDPFKVGRRALPRPAFNGAYLNVVTGLRRIIEAGRQQA